MRLNNGFVTVFLFVLLLQSGAGAQPPPGVLIERRLAEDLSLAVGDAVQLQPVGAGRQKGFIVQGIFERQADPNRISLNDYEVRLHLPDLQELLPASDRVDRFALVLSPAASPDSVARWVEGLAFGTRAYASADLADESSATFRVISRFHRAIGIVTTLASGIFLLCVMIIRVDERRRDMGLLRLMGFARSTVFRTVVLETVLIAGVGTAGGSLLGVLVAKLVNAYYMNFYDTTLRFALVTPQIVLTAALLGLCLGISAGVLAALRVVRVPPQQLGER